jgi:hypothetical protein
VPAPVTGGAPARSAREDPKVSSPSRAAPAAARHTSQPKPRAPADIQARRLRGTQGESRSRDHRPTTTGPTVARPERRSEHAPRARNGNGNWQARRSPRLLPDGNLATLHCARSLVLRHPSAAATVCRINTHNNNQKHKNARKDDARPRARHHRRCLTPASMDVSNYAAEPLGANAAAAARASRHTPIDRTNPGRPAQKTAVSVRVEQCTSGHRASHQAVEGSSTTRGPEVTMRPRCRSPLSVGTDRDAVIRGQ